MSKWEPRAIIVLILAISIAVGHSIAIVLAAWHGRPLTDVGGDVLIAVMGAIIAIIAGYVAKNGTNVLKDNTLPQEKTQEKEDAIDRTHSGGDRPKSP